MNFSFVFAPKVLDQEKPLVLRILALGKNSLYMTAKGYARKLLVENFIQLPTNLALFRAKFRYFLDARLTGFFFHLCVLLFVFAFGSYKDLVEICFVFDFLA